MQGKIVLKKKNAISFLVFVISISLTIGYFTAKGTALGGTLANNNYMDSAIKIQEFIEKEVEKNTDLKTIEKEANKLGKSYGLDVAFVESSYDTITVNIILDLDTKHPIISSFEIIGGK